MAGEPCNQAAAVAGTLPPPADPLLFAIEAAGAPARPVEDPWNIEIIVAPDLHDRWPFHMPAWNAVDSLWWAMLTRSGYWVDTTWFSRVAAWAGPVQRQAWVGTADPLVQGHGYAEYPTFNLVNIPGTVSEIERNSYIVSHAMEITRTDPVGGWQMNATWYDRGAQVLTSLLAWPLNEDKPTIVVGKSSGGGYAAAVATRLTQRPGIEPVALVTYGAPRWATPSLRDAITLAKHPQVIEFGTPGDPITMIPPPWSVVDGFRLQYNLANRPQYGRFGPLLQVRGADGVIPVPDESDFTRISNAVSGFLQGNVDMTQHEGLTYTNGLAVWAQSLASNPATAEPVGSLFALLADMNAAGV